MDGFPLSRENWAAMIEHEVLPDTVLTLDDEETPADYLLTRFTQQHGLPHPSAFKQKEEDTADKHDQVRTYKCLCTGVRTCMHVCTYTRMYVRTYGKRGGGEGEKEEVVEAEEEKRKRQRQKKTCMHYT